MIKRVNFHGPEDRWTLKTGYFEDLTPAIQVQTLPLEGPRSLGGEKSVKCLGKFVSPKIRKTTSEVLKMASCETPGDLHSIKLTLAPENDGVQ